MSPKEQANAPKALPTGKALMALVKAESEQLMISSKTLGKSQYSDSIKEMKSHLGKAETQIMLALDVTDGTLLADARALNAELKKVISGAR